MNSSEDSADAVRFWSRVTLTMEMATQLFQMYWCTTIPSLVTKGSVVQKTSSGQRRTHLFLTRKMLRNLLYHYQSHLFLIFSDGCCLLSYCSKCCWSVQRHGRVKVLCWRCYIHVHCFILYNIAYYDDNFCCCCCLLLTAFVCKMTRYCPVMGQKPPAVLYYLPREDSSSVTHRGRDILFIPQHRCQKAFHALHVIVDDGRVCVGTLPWINHLLPLSISGHTDAGSENTAQVTKELGLWTQSHCKTGSHLTTGRHAQDWA